MFDTISLAAAGGPDLCAPVRRALLVAGLGAILGGCTTLAEREKAAPDATTAPIAAPASAPKGSEAPVPDPARLMAGAAASMLGQPYRYGGEAPGGFDCSGLVVYAAGRAGIRLPRTAQAQLHAGVPIRRHELQAGDLVFMHLARKELHVGIAIDGERFVHAPSTGGSVRIDSLAARPYSGRFLGARRVVNGAGGT